MNAGARAIQGDLADGNTHAAGALVAQPQNAFVVRHDNQPDVALGPVPQHVRDTVAILGREPYPARLAENVAVFLARLSDHGRIDDRQQFGGVLYQDAIEEGLVSILKGRQADELLEIGLFSAGAPFPGLPAP